MSWLAVLPWTLLAAASAALIGCGGGASGGADAGGGSGTLRVALTDAPA